MALSHLQYDILNRHVQTQTPISKWVNVQTVAQELMLNTITA